MKTIPLQIKKSTARSLALQVLVALTERRAFVQEVLDKHLRCTALANDDRRLATQLVYGVLRRRSTLDFLLRRYVKRRRDQVELWLWEALRLGVYQLAILEHIPAHAAINETVELANIVNKPRGKNFLNGVLRNIARVLSEDRGDKPTCTALPLEEGRFRHLKLPLFPDPDQDAIGYFTAAFSFPRWLAERWLNRFGWRECVRLGFWCAGAAPLWLRCNTLRITRADLLTRFCEAGIQAEVGDHPQSIRLLEHAPIAALPGYRKGWFTVQDASAMCVASALSPESNQNVLDMCAAPGGKTTHIAELMGNRGRILACDVDEGRLAILQELCRRLGVTIIEEHPINSDERAEPPQQKFDAVLVDAPCSNTGVLGRRPEARWRLRPAYLQHLVQLQTRLLLQAADRTRSGGTILYSTCSVEPEENEMVVHNVLSAMPHLQLMKECLHVPGKPSDGGYWAKLLRR